MFPSPAKPRELSKHVTCIPWHEYQMFPSLQLTDEESVPNPQPAMVLLLIIWNFCLAIIVICICENGTSYFHRGQAAWSSIMWPLNVGQTKSPMWIFICLTQSFVRTFGIWMTPGPFGQFGLEVKYLGLPLRTLEWFYHRRVATMPGFSYVSCSLHSHLSIKILTLPVKGAKEDSINHCFLLSRAAVTYTCSNKYMFLFSMQWEQKLMQEWIEEVRDLLLWKGTVVEKTLGFFCQRSTSPTEVGAGHAGRTAV